MKWLSFSLLLALGSSFPACVVGFSVGPRPLVQAATTFTTTASTTTTTTTTSTSLHATVASAADETTSQTTCSSPDENHAKMLVWEALESELDQDQWETMKELVSSMQVEDDDEQGLSKEELAIVKFIIAAREQAKAAKDGKQGDGENNKQAAMYVWDAMENELSPGQWEIIKEMVTSQQGLVSFLNEEERAIIEKVIAARE